MKSDSTTIDACRSCGDTRLVSVLDLGSTPLANRLLRSDELEAEEPRFPLELVFCEGCTLVQLTETVSPEVLFREYVYRSSFSDAFVEHARRHVETLVAERSLGAKSLVVEAASNDGYLLQHFVSRGVPVLGVEPARNIAEIARARGVPTRAEFFGKELAAALRAEGLVADVVLGNNVLAHVPDPNGFVGGAADLIRDDGMVRFEFPYLGDLLAHLEFDTIYHEHLSYFSAHAIDALFRRNGLIFSDVERIPVHGGSLRATGSRAVSGEGRTRVEALLDEEKSRGLNQAATFTDLSRRVQTLKHDLRAKLAELKAAGKRIVAYGASAKGSTLLNVFEIGRDTLEWVADRSTAKQGRYTPGTHLEIVGAERLAQEQPDYALLLTWNFAEEILAQQQAYRSAGGRFIVPLPDVRIV